LPEPPKTSGSQTLSWSSASLTSAAPVKAPPTVPMPPSTAMNRYSMPNLMPNGDGFTLRCMWA
jgi:hypothetical protein